MLKSELRMQEYRANAEAAAVAAAGATLQSARERHLQSAMTWTALADAEQTRTDKALAAIKAAASRVALRSANRLAGGD